MERFMSFVLVIAIICAFANMFGAFDYFAPSVKNTLMNNLSENVEQNRFGVQAGTTGYAFMAGDAEWGFEGFPNLEVKSYENAGLAVQEMKNGNISYVVIDADVARSLVADNEGIKMIDIALTTEAYGIAVDKNRRLVFGTQRRSDFKTATA